MVRVVDLQSVEDDPARHEARVAEIVRVGATPVYERARDRISAAGDEVFEEDAVSKSRIFAAVHIM